jgi:hypothetical protein
VAQKKTKREARKAPRMNANGETGVPIICLARPVLVILGLVPRISRRTVLVQILGTSPRLSGLFCLQWRTALILLGLLNHPANRT